MEDCYDHIQKNSVRFEFIQEIVSREVDVFLPTKESSASADTQHKPILTILPSKRQQKKKPKRTKGGTLRLPPAKSSREIYDFLNLNN